jgi:DNA modification methylase
MEKANKSFCAETSNLDVSAILLRQNAKHILPRQHRDKVDHIITSPPYLISYEYSDLFRLSIYLFYYQNNYTKFKTSFIGTKLIKSVTGPRNGHVPRPRFLGIDDRDIYGWKKSIVNYYAEMASFILNARKHLKRKGKFILIVGDTTMRSIYIPNAYILSEIARHSGFRLKEKLKREIIGKYLPRYRDKATGKFTGRTDPNNKEVHKEEFILIFERQ